MDKGGLEEFAAVAHGEELVFAHEVVFAAVDFARTGLAGRVRDGELERRLELEKCVDERRLAGAGGRRHEKQPACVQRTGSGFTGHSCSPSMADGACDAARAVGDPPEGRSEKMKGQYFKGDGALCGAVSP